MKVLQAAVIIAASWAGAFGIAFGVSHFDDDAPVIEEVIVDDLAECEREATRAFFDALGREVNGLGPSGSGGSNTAQEASILGSFRSVCAIEP